MNTSETLYHVKDGYMVEDIAGKNILIAPAVGNIDYSKMLVLSESAALLVNHLIKESLSFDALLKLLLDEYEVDKELASKELNQLISELNRLNVLEA